MRHDPYTEAVERIVTAISNITGEDVQKALYLLSIPKEEYGDLSFPCIRYLKKTGLTAEDMARKLEEHLINEGIDYVKIETAGPGYINFRFDSSRLVERLSQIYRKRGEALIIPTHKSPLKLVVEHTSANPIHPMHIGHARNMSLGDTLARLLRARGHDVNTRFYIDDVGRQVAIAALGVKLLKIDPREESKRIGVKPDHLVGWIYSTTHLALDAAILRKRKDSAGEEERIEIEDKLLDIAASLHVMKERDPGDYFDRLLEAIMTIENPEEEISRLARRYEAGQEPEKSLVRMVAETVLEGHKATLHIMNVSFDSWDWESEMLWSGRVARILELARNSPYFTYYKGAEALDIPRFIKEVVKRDPDMRSIFKLPRGFDIPPLILRRSDGTTLYTTRDIAYSIYKFEVTGADYVYNVIGADQRLAQLQLRLALAALGFRREAERLVHYEYEMVSLPGRRMSSRKGTAIWLDDLFESLKERAKREVEQRNPGAPEDWIEETARKIARAALRFRLVQISAPKPIVFDPEKALDLTENSGPYLQYTHARAHSILRKLGSIDYDAIDPDACSSGKRRRLLISSLRFPLTAAKAADDLAPEILSVYLLRLADVFNSWYQEDRVIGEPEAGARHCKALLVAVVREALAKGLSLLGIDAPERM